MYALQLRIVFGSKSRPANARALPNQLPVGRFPSARVFVAYSLPWELVAGTALSCRRLFSEKPGDKLHDPAAIPFDEGSTESSGATVSEAKQYVGRVTSPKQFRVPRPISAVGVLAIVSGIQGSLADSQDLC